MALLPDVTLRQQQYKILHGDGKGSIGVATEQKENGFGLKWAKIVTETGEWWVRTELLEEVSA